MVTRCHNCSTKTERNQKFYDISLHFPEEVSVDESVSLVDMLSDYATKSEELSGHNQFFCDKCGKWDQLNSNKWP